jgi:hypothetical protein
MSTPDIPGWSNVPQREILVEYWPGLVSRVNIPATRPAPPEYALCRYIPRRDGVFQLVPVSWHGCVRLTLRLPARLGLHCSYRVLYRLVASGLVAGYRLSPKTTLIDLGSLYDHLMSCHTQADSPYWTADRRRDVLSSAGLSLPEMSGR